MFTLPSLAQVLLGVFCLGGLLLFVAIFEGEFGLFKQTVDTSEMETVKRCLAGFFGIAFVGAAMAFLPSRQGDLAPLPGFCALFVAGILVLAAIVRGPLNFLGLKIEGEAVSSFARLLSTFAALLIGLFGFILLFPGITSASPSCPAGTRLDGSACLPSVRATSPDDAAVDSSRCFHPTRLATGWHAQTYIQLASERLEQDAKDRSEREARNLNQIACVFKSARAFGIALGPMPKQEASDTLDKLRSVGSVPTDAFVAPVDDSQIVICCRPPDTPAF